MVKIKVAISSKTTSKYYCLVITYGEEKKMYFFVDVFKVCKLLNLSPQQVYDLEVGEYSIV